MAEERRRKRKKKKKEEEEEEEEKEEEEESEEEGFTFPLSMPDLLIDNSTSTTHKTLNISSSPNSKILKLKAK